MHSVQKSAVLGLETFLFNNEDINTSAAQFSDQATGDVRQQAWQGTQNAKNSLPGKQGMSVNGETGYLPATVKMPCDGDAGDCRAGRSA